MDAATRNKVDDAREIIEAVRYKPLQARTKVFILDEVHMLTTQAFNALLKTLEEPPPHITFIFATTEIRKVPITVLSRCQRFDLRRISKAELADLFTRVAKAEQVAVAPAAMDLIARAADGSARDGLSLLDQAIARMEGAEVAAAEVTDMLGLADRQTVFDLMEAIVAGKVGEALAITDRAYAFGADLGTVLTDLVELVHMLTRLRSVPDLREGSVAAGSRAHPRRQPGRPAFRAGAQPPLADAAEGAGGGRLGPGPPGRGGDGADPAVPRVRPATCRAIWSGG